MKLHPLLALLPIVTSLGTFSCKTSSRSDTKTEISSQSAKLPSSGLGEGFDSDTSTFVGTCVEGKKEFVAASQGEVNFFHEMSYEEVVDSLSGGVKLGAKFSIFNIEGAAEYASREASDDFSYTTSLLATSELQKVSFQPTGLSPIGATLVNAGGDVSDEVRRDCGDEFVSHITYGARLFVNVKFRFQSSQDKEEFTGKGRMELAAIGELGGNIGKLSDRIKKSTTVTISAQQTSGAVQKLPEILDQRIFSCSMADFEKSCLPTLQKIISYAQNDYVNSLENPIDNKLSIEKNIENLTKSGWSQLRYTTKPYADAPISVAGKTVRLVPAAPKSLITREIKVARDEVYEAYEKELSAYQRSSDMIKDGGLTNVQRDNLKKVQKATSDNRRALAEIGETCTRNPNNCIADFEAYKASAKPWDERALSLKTCLVESDVVDSVWEMTRTNNTPVGIIRLAPDGKIQYAASGADATWKVEGCLLRFFNDKGAHTSTFDDIQSWDKMTGIYYFDGSFRHVLQRLDPESDKVKEAIKKWTDNNNKKMAEVLKGMASMIAAQKNQMNAEMSRKANGK